MSSSGSIRLPSKFTDTARLNEARPPEVPRNVAEAAFHVWDTDCDESIQLDDLVSARTRPLVYLIQPPTHQPPTYQNALDDYFIRT